MATEKTLLEQVQDELKASKLAVYDKDGKLVGHTGPDPEPEGPTAHEFIAEGYAQMVTDAEREMVPIIEQMTQDAKTARALLDRTSQWDVKGRLEAEKKRAELYAKFHAARGQRHELRRTAGMYSQSTPFLKAVDVFENNLERHFTEEVPFVLNRF